MYPYPYAKIKIAVAILLFFVGINLYFNFPLWNQVFRDDSRTISYHGEILLLHLSGETIYQNILKGINPFTTDPGLMYPFGASYAINDLAPINGYYFLLFRPFFSIHQSVSLIAAISILLAHIFMYLFLRRLNISRAAALIMATSYGFTPLLAARMGAQLSYDSIFLYPLIGIFLHIVIMGTKSWSKVAASLGLGISAAILVLSNLNYTIIFAMIFGLYFLYAITMHFKDTYTLIKRNVLYLFISGVTATICLFPWLQKVIELARTDGIPRGSSAGTLEFSGHLLGFFIPSQWNHYYQPLMTKLYTISPYMATQSEGFVYPGLVVLGALILYLLYRRKLPISLKRDVMPHLAVALVGAVLSLGPYLHLASHYRFPVFGRYFSIPLPFILLQKIPLLGNFRSPGRLALILVFAGTIFAAYIFDYFLARIRTKQLAVVIATLLMSIVLIDQDFMHVKATAQTIPSAIYQELARDKEQETVMEIPFTLRDGLEYIGSLDDIFYQLGHFVYPNPIIGTHTGRINEYVFDYYRNNAFIGYIGQLIDSDGVHAKRIDPLGVMSGKSFDLEAAKRSADFLDIDAIILKTTKNYSPQIENILTSMGYVASTRDGDFTLYRRQSPDENSLCIPFGTQVERLHLGRGWDSTPNAESKRWVIGKRANFFVKSATDTKVTKVEFVAESLSENKISITLGEQTVEMDLQAGEHTYTLPITSTLNKGLFQVYLAFDRATAPSTIISTSDDGRQLSARFSKVCFFSL